MTALSLDKDRIKFLLLEGVHPAAHETLGEAGYKNVECVSGSLSGAALIEALQGVHFLGIRSRTQLTEDVIAAAERLAAVGCFCIGTNQVDLSAAERHGVPVFNAPFSNTRSVAELVLAEAILLMRGIAEKNALAHRGQWAKTAQNSYEVRGKRLGIIGYGHIGSQLGVLAEALGMGVTYYDVEHKLPLGNAEPAATLSDLLQGSDVVSLHVPATPETEKMIDGPAINAMRAGSVIINASRGNVLDIDALANALRSGHIAGAAIDVFPVEPRTNEEEFTSPLRGFDNVILTPHVGGSTQEAQRNIAVEVANKLVRYSDNGSTTSAVNFPQVSMPDNYDRRRLLHIHRNEPGVLERVNGVFAANQVNISAQYLQTSAAIGYVVMDVEHPDAASLLAQLKTLPGTIRARLLH